MCFVSYLVSGIISQSSNSTQEDNKSHIEKHSVYVSLFELI